MTPKASTARVAVVTVTYHPEPGMLERQFAALPSDGLVVLVDNQSGAAEVANLQALAARRADTHLILNPSNAGLASALNQGVRYVAATDTSREFVLLMDQDSEPHPGSIGQLLESMLRLEEAGESVGCVGPRLVDNATGLQHGFHCMGRWRWFRRFPKQGSSEPISCANLNGSGTMVRTKLFLDLGGLDESLFIDHVDTEWAFRVLAAGHALFGIPQATFNHGMGERGLRFWWFGWRVWPQRAPMRHYYLFRNTVSLWARDYVPRVWKAWSAAKLALTMMINGVFGPRRIAQMQSMLRGVLDGRRTAALWRKDASLG